MTLAWTCPTGSASASPPRPPRKQPIRAHQQLIGNETLATAFELLSPDALDHDASAGAPAQVGDGETIRVRISSPGAARAS